MFAVVNNQGWNAAHIAAQNGHLPCLKLLIKASKGGCLVPDDHEDTPLHVAQLYAQAAVVNFLQERKGGTERQSP